MQKRSVVSGGVLVCFWSFCVIFGASQASAKQINFKAALNFAVLANAAYSKPGAIKKSVKGVTRIASPGKISVQYFLRVNAKNKTQTISVRGTVDGTNKQLNDDLRAVHDKKTGIVLHGGYKSAAEILYKDLKPHLKKGYTTYLTGHSLGGAVAAILSLYMRVDKYRIGRIYTYGQPKITDPKGAKKYRGLPLLRFVNQNDVVALWPEKFKDKGLTFAHIGPAVNLLAGPHYVYAGTGVTLKFSQGSLRKFFRQVSVPDHRMERYVKSLRRKIKVSKEVKFDERLEHIDRSPYEPVKRKQNFGSQSGG